MVMRAGVLAVALAVLFSGCTTSDEEGSCYFDVQTMIDSGDYEAAIDRLENDTICQDAYGDNTYLVSLGVAYMGKAGLGVTDTFTAVSAATDTQSDEAFGEFLKVIDEKTDGGSLIDLQKSVQNFDEYLVGVDCEATDLGYMLQDVCTYKGVAEMLTASTTFTYLTDDVEGWISGDNITEMQSAACALQYAVSGDTVGGACGGMTLTVDDANVTFDNNVSYEAFHISSNGTEYYYLASDAGLGTTVVTDGYCDTSFTTCDKGVAECYACPVNQMTAEDELAVSEILVNTLNNSFDSISQLIDDPDLQTDLDEFKEEVAGDTGDITLQDIIDYLSN